ncbi:MAG: TetR/AcrR family transcriptional regulator [Mycobacterium sp.]
MPPAEQRQSPSEYGDLADRILSAAGRLMLTVGARKLSLSDVATLAGVSRPTIYRYFASKEDLIEALGAQVRRRFDAAMEHAMSGVTGVARWEAAIDVVVTFLGEHPPGRQLDLDPRFAHEQMARALPMITEKLTVVLRRCAREDGFDAAAGAPDLAGAIARVAFSHYTFPDTDPAVGRRQIRAAAGLPDRLGSDSKLRRTR